MLFDNFRHKLKQLNNHLWIDVDRETTQRDPEFPTAGLYYENHFLMGVPHIEVPEYSIAGIDFNELIFNKEWEELHKIKTTGLATREKILWRGYKAILHSLVRQGYINKLKTEKLFSIHFEEKRKEYPRNYIQKEI